MDLRDDAAYLERFLQRRMDLARADSNNPHVLQNLITNKNGSVNFILLPLNISRDQTLSQWMIDNRTPKLESVRNIMSRWRLV